MDATSLAPDVLIFRATDATLSLVGGHGRGAGWMGIVDLPLATEPVASRVLRSSRPERVDADDDEPLRVVGPYWAQHAFLVPVGPEHLVVFGGRHDLEASDATLVPASARLVAELRQVAPDKLLADELEVVQAVRDLMDWRPESVADTVRHIAARTADSLSCEVGGVFIRANGRLVAEVVTRDWPATIDSNQVRGTLVGLFARVEQGALLEPELEAVADDQLGRNLGLVARFAVPIGRPQPFGVLVIAHAAGRARGFTNLCQRIGHALADAAEPLLLQAISREQLTVERDRYAIAARTDGLTGLENRAAWDELVEYEDARRARYGETVSIVSADLDDLKGINDRNGHAMGDAAIRAAAELLRGCSRAVDRVARVGGDEFLVLMPETDELGADRFVARLRERSDVAISLGCATCRPGEALVDTVRRADDAMYADKAARGVRRSPSLSRLQPIRIVDRA